MNLKCSDLFKINGNCIVYVISASIIYISHSPKNTDVIFLNFSIFCVPDSSPFPSSVPHAFQINFNSLYTALCEQQTSDQATLLLYTLLHQNSNVRTYMLARTDMENLVSVLLNIFCFLYFIIFWRIISLPKRICLPGCKGDSQEIDGEMPPNPGRGMSFKV